MKKCSSTDLGIEISDYCRNKVKYKMSKLDFISPRFKRTPKGLVKLDPLSDFGMHLRSRKMFGKPSASKFKQNKLRLCSSLSPKLQLAEKFLDGFDSLCETARKNITMERNSMVSLRLTLNKQPVVADDFEERKMDLLSECKKFVNGRKYTLKSKQDFLLTKKLQKSMTNKMIGKNV